MVLLLNPPSTRRVSRDYYCGHFAKARYGWPPFDLLVLSGRLPGRDVLVLDAIAEGLDAGAAMARIDALRPVAVLAVVAAVSWREDVAFLSRVKARCGSAIAVSGDYPRACPADALDRHDAIDAVVLDFADCDLGGLPDGAVAGGLRNVHTRLDPEPRFENARTFRLPGPRHELFDLCRYHLPTVRRHPFTLVTTDFGCRHGCAWCYHERVPHKLRDLDDLASELAFVRSLGVPEIVLQDQSFGSVRPHAIEACAVLSHGGSPFTWVCEMRPDDADPDLLRAMRRAGCHTVMLGVETASRDVLARHRKRSGPDDARRAFALAREAGIRTLAHFLLGLPGEDEASLRRTLDLCMELEPDIASFNVAAPAWGTTLRHEVVANGWMIEDGVGIAGDGSRPVWESPSLPRDTVVRVRDEALRRFYMRPSYVVRQLLSVRSAYQLRTLIAEGLDVLRSALPVSPR